MLTVKLYEQLPEEAVRIRKEVFMDEQGFCNEFDEIDKTALHAVLYEDDKAQRQEECIMRKRYITVT